MLKIFSIAIIFSLTQVVLSYVNEDHLPDDIIPISYKIQLDLGLDDELYNYNGKSNISIHVRKPTNIIVFYAGDNVEIDSEIKLNCQNYDSDIKVSSKKEPWVRDKKRVELTLNGTLENGTDCELSLKYTGVANNFPTGLYRSSLTTRKETKLVVSTIFQPQRAHQVFPCWDEPAFRANFTISIKHDKKYIALSNMHEIKHEIDPTNETKIITYFAETPKMSPSFIALNLGQYIRKNSTNPAFRVWVQSEYAEYADYATQIGPILLNALENYTDMPYKNQVFQKLDLVIIPFRKRLNGMENWGLISYSAWSVLVSEKPPVIVKKVQVTQTLAYALAYQWFSGLVTTTQNIYRPFSKGFIKYLEYFIPDQIEPNWRMMDRFVREVLQAKAFVLDMNSHGMEQEEVMPSYLRRYQDAMTPEKAASIIRTISFCLGQDKFQTAVRNYLRTKAFELTTLEDLYEAIKPVQPDNVDLQKILKNWVTVQGHPVIYVNRTYTTNTATITQSRFLNDSTLSSDESYWVPINYVTADDMNFIDTNVTHWLSPNTTSITIKDLNPNNFILLNKQLFGFYRVNYDEKNWKLITEYLKKNTYKNIHVLNRVQLIDDAFHLASSGYIKYKVFLSLIQYLEKEQDFIPWKAAWNAIEMMYKFIKSTSVEKQFKDYIVKISKNLVDNILSTPLNKDDANAILKANEALKLSCLYGSKRCRTEISRRLNNWLDNSNAYPLSSMEKGWVLCEGMREANATLAAKFYEKYWELADADVLYATGCNLNLNILKPFVKKSMMTFRSYSDLISTFDIIESQNENYLTVIFDFLGENMDEIENLMGYDVDNLHYYLKSLCGRIKNPSELMKIQEYAQHYKGVLKDMLDEGIAIAQNNLRKVDKRVNEIADFFSNNS